MNGLPGSLQRWTRGVWLAGCLLAAATALAQVVGPDLWTKRDMPPGLPVPSEVLSSMAVNVDVGLLRSERAVRLSLLMPDGNRLPATRSRVVNTPKGVVWSGTIDHQTNSAASFSVVNETVAGSFLTDKGQSFRLRRDPSGIYLLEEIDLRKLPREGQATPASGQRGDKGNDPAADTCTTDSGDDIDVMVVFTAAARVGAGGLDALEADIYLAVEQANQSYINSDVAQQLRVVHIAEVSYAESGVSLTDRNRLQDKGDGFMDNVHSLRDSHRADVVALITQTLDECGRGFVMESVGNAFEDHAFSVVKRDCMSVAGKHSLAHELGHLMGARHDWNDDAIDNKPYPYNHGHIERAPVTPPPWSTVMAYDDLCTNAGIACPRALNWSNPNISIGGKPTGVGSGLNQADNHRTLNDTAWTVANFRCASPGRNDVWMKDTWSDNGSEPDPAQAARPMWESPYIWVRNARDPLLIDQHKHQNPVSGQANYVYVKLHNGGAATSGNLDIRVANATMGLVWTGNWTKLQSVPVAVTLAASTTRVVEVPWTPPAAGHFCLVARWDSASDPMTTPETGNIEANVRGNNNIVWHNVNIVDLGADASADAAFEVPGVGAGRNFVLAVRPVPTRRPGGPRVPGFMDFGRVTLTLDERLMEAWKRTSHRSTGLRYNGNTITVLDPKGAQLSLGAVAAPGRARITFSRPSGDSFPRDEFGWHVTQSPADDVKPQAVGGITYRVRTFAP